MKHIYLSAPFEFSVRDQHWKSQIRRLGLSDGISVTDPCPPDTSDSDITGELKEEENWEELSNVAKYIVERDLAMLAQCDGCIVYWPDGARTAGCIHEIIVCFELELPVVLVAPAGKSCVPTWLFGVLGHERIFDDIEEAYKAIRREI